MSTIMIHTKSKEYQTKAFIYTNTNPNPKLQVLPSHTAPYPKQDIVVRERVSQWTTVNIYVQQETLSALNYNTK